MLELNKIYCMDCLEGIKKLSNNSVSLVVTDPPYTTPIVTGFGRKKVKNVADLSIQEQYMVILKKKFEKVLKPNAPVFIFCDDKYYPTIFRAFYDWNALQLVIWDKGRIGMGKPFRKQHELILYANRNAFEYYRRGLTYSTILKYKPIPISERLHPAEKPLELIKDLIKGFSKKGELVVDCFMGGGTVALACKQTNRNFIGFELNKEYYDIANKRLEQENIKSFLNNSKKNKEVEDE